MPRLHLHTSGTTRLDTAGAVSPHGTVVSFLITGTSSLVLARNTAPPGEPVSLTNIPFVDGSGVFQSAGTAITSSGVAVVTANDAARGVYVVLTHTSGFVVVTADAVDRPGASAATQAEPHDFLGPIRVRGRQVGDLHARVGTNSTAAFISAVDDDDVLAPLQVSGSTQARYVGDGTVLAETLSATGQVTQGGLAGAATTRTRLVKAVSAIANNSATALATITVPNAAHTCVLRVILNGALGAGGAIGAGEASASNGYLVTIVRTAGVNAVGTVSSAFGAAAAAVAGAATCTATLTLSSVSGAVGAVNTFTLNGTIARSGGSSDNHTARLAVEVVNANASGITIA